MPLLKVLEVIWIDDDFIKPPGPKMVACVEPELGLFFRINSKGHWPGSVLLPLQTHRAFLRHDSYLECGTPLEFDDYLVEESVRRRGIVGSIDPNQRRQIAAMVDKTPTISVADKQRIKAALGC